MDDNYFDPMPSPNLPEDDPMRDWARMVQSDPDLPKLMATDPQAAIDKMRTMGIPPPPQGFSAYTDGLGAENTVPRVPPYRGTNSGPGVFGGAEPAPPPAAPLPQGGDPLTADARKPSIAERVRGLFPTFGPDGKMMGNMTSEQGVPSKAAPGDIPLPTSDPRKAAPVVAEDEAGAALEGTPLPRSRPREAGPGASDISARKKENAGDAFADFGKSLQGIKPVAPVPPQKISSPSLPSHAAIQSPQLSALLSLVGQPASPIAMTLGRLLATGKA